MIIKTKGIVIRSLDFQETSKIVTVLTADHGKIALLAKGARSPKSKYGYSLQVMNELELVYYFKPSRDIQTLSQTENLVKRKKMTTDYDIMMLGFKLLEWINKIHITEHESAALFNLLSKALETLDTQEHIHNGLYGKFLLRLSQIMGYEPNYSECGFCERLFDSLTADNLLGISISSGQLFCDECRRNSKTDYTVKKDVVTIINHWLFPRQFSLPNGTLTYENYQNVQMIVERHIGYHLEIKHN